MEFYEELEDYLRVLVTLLALAIFVVAALAYRRRPTGRVLLMLVAFAVYVVKGALISLDLVFPEKGNLIESLAILGDALFLILIGAAVLKA